MKNKLTFSRLVLSLQDSLVAAHQMLMRLCGLMMICHTEMKDPRGEEGGERERERQRGGWGGRSCH